MKVPLKLSPLEQNQQPWLMKRNQWKSIRRIHLRMELRLVLWFLMKQTETLVGKIVGIQIHLSPLHQAEGNERQRNEVLGRSVSLVYETCTVFFVLFGIWMTIILCVYIAACIGGPKVTEKLKRGGSSTD